MAVKQLSPAEMQDVKHHLIQSVGQALFRLALYRDELHDAGPYTLQRELALQQNLAARFEAMPEWFNDGWVQKAYAEFLSGG